VKLSVIIVSYNEKQYLTECVASCLQQSFGKPYEIIIGDDGSNDGSIELIKEIAEKYPKIVKWFVMDRENTVSIIPSLRVSKVLKRAFQMAAGEYLMVLSGDDLICSKYKFARQALFLDQNPQFSSCYTDFKRFWDDGTEETATMRCSIGRANFWSRMYVHISCFMFKRNALNGILNRFCDDTGLLFTILKTGKAGHIPDIMLAYRQRDKSIMHKADKLELQLLEISLYQDIRNQKEFYFSSLARFSDSFHYVYKHKDKLKDYKYKKYLDSAENDNYDFLVQLKDYNNLGLKQKLKIHFLMLGGRLLKYLFACTSRADILFHCILKI
jgi:glycosyltransferase involved in cell wall biosynthesis